MKLRERLLSDPLTLAAVPPGMLVRVAKMDKLPVERRDHLMAFGLTPGRWVEIKQHRPAVVVQVDYTELAIEPEDASKILVETPVPLNHVRRYHRGAAGGRRRRRRPFFLRRMRRRRRLWFLSRLMGWQDRENKE